MEHRSADFHPVEVGRRFWNSDLRVVEVLELANDLHTNDYQGKAKQSWHRVDEGDGRTMGRFDTLDGGLTHIGRLARYYKGKDAEQYEPGTNYRDVK